MGQINLQVPIVGQPNSTEDPKIISDFNTLQTLVNGNLDPTNMSPSTGILHLANRVAASNTVAATGDMILASGGITITLPAPSLNAVVGVVCYATNACGVVGTNIFGIGLSAASSFNLAMGAAVILHSDGTNWHMIAGQQDTGWLTITPTAGYNGAPVGNYVASVRVRGDQAMLKGSITSNSTNNAFGTVPTAARAAAQVTFGAIVAGGAAPLFGYMPTTGVLTSGGSIASGYSMYLDGLSYSLS